MLHFLRKLHILLLSSNSAPCTETGVAAYAVHAHRPQNSFRFMGRVHLPLDE